MFATCRPVIRHCDRGHVVVEGEGECEDGHPVVGDDPAGQVGDSFLGQLRAAVQPSICRTGLLDQVYACMGDKLSKLTEKKSDHFSNMPDPVVVSPSAKHTATLIFLHGLGDTGHGWASSIAAIRPPHVKVVCPTANKMAVTLNSGFQMPSWFDLMSLDPAGPEDEAGIKAAAKMVDSLIAEEIKSGIPASRILIGGFSQGGALALYSSLHTDHNLAGTIALSCWAPLHKQMGAAKQTNKDIPYLQAHGDCDPVVPYRWGQMTAQLLKTVLPNHTFKTYKGLMHSSSEEEMQDVKQFIATCLP